jgi:hypothetical protein
MFLQFSSLVLPRRLTPNLTELALYAAVWVVGPSL